MKSHQLRTLLVALGFLLGRTPLLAAEAAANAYLAFACDGTARERQVLFEQSATWIVNQSRTLDPKLGRAVYRVRVGRAPLDRVRLEVNLVPDRLEFSGDGNRWEILASRAGMASKPMEFTTQDASFTAAQCEAASASGFAWFRVRSADESQPEFVQLKYFRLDVRGAEVPPHFARLAWWSGLDSFAVGPLTMAVGVVPAVILWRRWGARWRVWVGGAALWAVSVALKFGVAALANGPMSRWLHVGLPQSWANLALWCYLGLLTGVFECGIFLVVAPLIKRKQWRWGEALALGLAFGAFEALAVGTVAVVAASQTSTWACLSTWSDSLISPFERLLTLPIHTAAVVMILRALLDRKWRWFWASFAYKSAVDGVASWLLLSGTGLLSHLWLAEWLCFAPFAFVGVLTLLYLGRRWTEPSTKRVAELTEVIGHS